jgi:hypothetical protein
MGSYLYRWRLGFNQFRFRLYPLQGFMRTGLAVHHATYLRV